MVVAIPVKLRYTVVGEAWDEPTTEGSVARPDRRRADESGAGGSGDECAGWGGSAGAGVGGGCGRLLVHRGGAAGRAPLGGRGRRVGGAVQPGGTRGGRAAPRGRREGEVWRHGARAHPGRGAADAGPGAGPDRDLVADDAPTGTAQHRGWAARGEHVHHLVRAARGRPELAARPLVVPHRAGDAAPQDRRGRSPRPRCDGKKGLIEQAYTQTEVAVWTQDEAGPYQAIPQPGDQWRPTTSPARYPHEHIRHGTAKLLTLFEPASGLLHVKGVTSAANAVLHPWLETELTTILAALPEPAAQSERERRAAWAGWQDGLTVRFTLPERVPPLRMLLVLDNLTGHKTPSLVLWLVEHGVMPLYTPLSGSWLNMAESIQRILVRRALAGQTPTSPNDIIDWLEATARGWNADPTPFEWAGKRLLLRQRSRQRHHHALGGSGATTRRPIHCRPTALDQWRRPCQVTH